jgi:hypothetical protein
MVSCRVNVPSLRPNIRRDTDTKKQEQGFNVAFEIWLMNFTKKQRNGSAKITVLYSYPNLRLRIWFLNVRGKLTQRLLEICLFGVTTDSRRDWWTRLESTQTAELLFAVKSTLAKLTVNVDIFIARLGAQRSLNAQDVIRNLIETLMQLELFYWKTWV